MDVQYVPDFFIWKRQEIAWKPGHTHLSCAESVHADLNLNDDELRLAEEYRRVRMLEKSARWRERQREQDEVGYKRWLLDQDKAWGAKNPGRVNEIAAGVRKKAKDARPFHCDICDFTAATQASLDSHLHSITHAAAVKSGGKVTKPLTATTGRARKNRAARRAEGKHSCSTCNKIFDGAWTTF